MSKTAQAPRATVNQLALQIEREEVTAELTAHQLQDLREAVAELLLEAARRGNRVGENEG